jgi:pimeloyl-ACP methyl ester carboxylesterase
MGQSRAWRWVRRIGGGLVAVVVVLGAMGALWNALAVRQERHAHPPPGQLYIVDGHVMHLYCTGEGSPTLVLESGHGEDFTVWGKVQPALSRITRTCAYDRAGFGWSDTQSGARDAVHIADQLHALLAKAGMTQPVILMAHSAGGLYARVYASRFPGGVTGLILIDATSPAPLPMPPLITALDHHSGTEFALVKAMVALGIARAAGQCDVVPKGLEHYAGRIKANACIPSQQNAYEQEDEALTVARTQAAEAGPFGNLPILVLSQDPQNKIPPFLAGRLSANDWHTWTTNHDLEQQAYIKLSARSRRVIAQGSGHYVHYDRPDVVIREVTAFIQSIRG